MYRISLDLIPITSLKGSSNIELSAAKCRDSKRCLQIPATPVVMAENVNITVFYVLLSKFLEVQ